VQPALGVESASGTVVVTLGDTHGISPQIGSPLTFSLSGSGIQSQTVPFPRPNFGLYRRV
jgi:hypothetical protein